MIKTWTSPKKIALKILFSDESNTQKGISEDFWKVNWTFSTGPGLYMIGYEKGKLFWNCHFFGK